MSYFVEEDWKLKAHAEVKLRRENTNMFVSLSYIQYLKYTDITKADAILRTVVYDDAYFLFSRRLTSYLWRHLSNVI